MPEVLIIRSASIQQLDLNLPAIKAKFGASALSVLTHAHVVSAVEKYAMVDKIYIYNHKSGFRFWRKAAGLSGCRFDAVIVQTANPSGSGYLNVLLFAAGVRAKKIYTCNPASEITEIKKSTIALRAVLTVIFKCFSLTLTVPTAILLCLIAVPRICYAKCYRKRR